MAIPDGVRSLAQSVVTPDGEPEVAEPEVAAPTVGAPRYRLGGDGTIDDCLLVGAEGLPAIDGAGELVAASQEQWLQLTPFPGSTTCDPLFTAQVLHWDEETFAALDAHPCADPESEDGRCHGVDYGF